MKILLVDDHIIIRKGLIVILREEFNDCEFFEASDGAEAISILRKESLSLALLDISMPKLNGIDVLKQVKALEIKTPIIILSMQPEDQYAIRVLKVGAYGFLNKNSRPETLINAVKKVLSGKKYTSETVAAMLASSVRENKDGSLLENLSDREMEVIQYIAKGKTLTEISKKTALSVNTISTYKGRILKKLGLKNSASLIKFAMNNNIV